MTLEAEDDTIIAPVIDTDDDDTDTGPQSVEDIAVAAGWKPKAEWKGDKTGWVSAAQFVARGLSGVSNARKEVKALKDQVSRFDVMHREALTRQRANIEASYRRQRKEAIEAGDADAVEALDEQREQALAQVKAPEPKPEALEAEEIAEAITDNPLAKKFFAANAWLMDDEDAESVDAFNWSGKLADKLQAEGSPPSMMYRIIEKALREHFPDRYAVDEEEEAAPEKDPKTGQFVRRAPVTNVPGRGGLKATLASKLPPEARAAAKADVKEGLFKSEEEYAERYFANVR